MGRVPLTQWLSQTSVAEWQAPSIFSKRLYARYVTSRARIFIVAISTRRVFSNDLLSVQGRVYLY